MATKNNLRLRDIAGAMLMGIKPAELRSVGFSDSGSIFGTGVSSSGVPVTTETALSQASVLSAIRLVSETLASFPLRVDRQGEGKASTPDPTHPLYDIVYNAPNGEMTPFTFKQTLVVHMFLYKGAYIRVNWRRGYVASLEILYPPAVVQYDGYYMAWIRTSPMGTGQMVKLLPHEVVKIPFMLPFDNSFEGSGLIDLAEDPIGLALAIDTYAGSYFRNGATVAGFFSSEKQVPEDVKNRILKMFNRDHGGSGNAFKVAFTPTGAKFEKITNNPQESQSIEQREFEVREIARMFRINPRKLGAKDTGTVSLEDENLEFLDFCILPLAVRIEEALGQRCLTASERKTHLLKFDFSELLRPNYLTRQQGLAIQRQNGIINGNEWRISEGAVPVDDPVLDAYLVLSNMGGIGYQNTKGPIEAQTQGAEKPTDTPPERGIPEYFAPIVKELSEKLAKRAAIEAEKAQKRGHSEAESFDPRPLAESVFASILAQRGLLPELDTRLLKLKTAYSEANRSLSPAETSAIIASTLS